MFLQGKTISMSSPAAILFPSNHPAGYCSMALVQFLSEAHNTMVMRYCEDYGLSHPVKMAPSELTADQLVCFHEREMHLLLLASSEYEMNVDGDGEARWNIDLKAIEERLTDRQVINRFF